MAPTLSIDQIRKAKEKNISDDVIVDTIARKYPDYAEKIKTARSKNISNKVIVETLERKLTQQNTPENQQIAQQNTPENTPPNVKPLYIENPQVVDNKPKESVATTLNQAVNPKQDVVKPESLIERLNPVGTQIQEMGREEDDLERLIEGSTADILRTGLSFGLAGEPETKKYLKETGKGALSGASFGLTENIPALKPEGTSESMIGEFLGSILPIELLSQVTVRPLVALAKRSPILKGGLESFARIIGMGVTGSAYEATKDVVKSGELPTPDSLIKNAKAWAGFEAVLQTIGYVGKFASLVKASKRNPEELINEIISKVDLAETNPEVLKNQVDTAIKEVFPERSSLSKEQVASSKEELIQAVDSLPNSNKKSLAQKAIERKQIRTPEQLDQFLQEYETLFPGISGKTIKDRNRKFLNKYSDKNKRERKFSIKQEAEAPAPKMSDQEKLKRAKLEFREAKKSGDKERIKEAKKKLDIQKSKIEGQKQSQAIKDEKKVEAQELKQFEEVVETKESKSIQKKIDIIEDRIKKAEESNKTAQVKVLQKNLQIQKQRLKKARAVRKNSVPQNPAEVNTKDPTLVAETPDNITNPNIPKAISESPVETLQQGMYIPDGLITTDVRPGFNKVTGAIKGLKRGVRRGVKWVFKKGGQSILKENPESNVYKMGWRAAEDYIATRHGLKERFFTRWNESIGKNKNISKQDRSDMIFYRERTGNPFINGDTFEALSARMSPESKHIVDTVVDKHMKETLRLINESPFMQGKNVNPRQAVEDIYIRHFYAGKISPEKINTIFESMQKRFGTDNPFKNQRTFLTFDQALKEAGLVPKYQDIVQNLAAQDGMLVRVLSNNELVSNLHDIEQAMGQKLVVRSTDKNLYQQAKNDGWVPFTDPYMRSYVAGTNKSGKKIWATTEAPALVHPDLAPSMEGIFTSSAYKPDNSVLRLYDRFNSAMNKVQVAFSLFHFNALGESFTGSGGFITSLALGPKWWKRGTKLLEQSPFVEDAVRHGLKINRPVDLELETANTFYQKMLMKMQASKYAPIRLGGKLGETANAMAGIHKFLFGSFQPRMKIITYENYVNRILRHYEKKGMYPNQELLREVKREAAKAVNDQFGGQVFELIPYMNNKNTNKIMHRVLSYPDWTVSAIREVYHAIASDSPIRRKLGQRYLIEYGLGLAFGTQLLSYATTGLTNKPDGSITWDPSKAHSTFENEDPKRRNFFDVQMPDVTINIAGEKISLGRDEGGRSYYMHGGKKVREIGRYFSSPVAALFSKSSPLIRNAFKYATDHTPSEEGLFPARGAYVEGEFRPWDGTKKGTIDRALSYSKDILESTLPFSVQTIVNDFFNSTEDWKKALARTGFKFASSGIGAFSVSKGISLRSSEPYWEEAFNIQDTEKRNESLNALRALLKGYGYEDKKINAIESKVKKRVTGKAERR